MKKITVAFIIITFIFALWGCQYPQYFPTDGIWYCPELNMQLDFLEETGWFVYNETQIVCGFGYDKGSSWLYVGCQDYNNPYFAVGEDVLIAEFVHLDAERLILLEVKTGKEYCFRRMR